MFGFPHSPKTTEPISEPTDIHAAVHVLDGLNEGFAGRVAELVVEKILLGVGDQENLRGALVKLICDSSPPSPSLLF